MSRSSPAPSLSAADLVRYAEDLLELRDRDVTEAALRQELTDCVQRQARYRQGLRNAYGAGEDLARGMLAHLLQIVADGGADPAVRWATDRGQCVVYLQDATRTDLAGRLGTATVQVALLVFLAVRLTAEAEAEEDLRTALLDLLGRERRALTAAERAFLDRYESHAHAEAPTLPPPSCALPGSPAKVRDIELRARFQMRLFRVEDFRLIDMADAEARAPVHAAGNFALVGSTPLAEAERKLSHRETLAERCRRWVAEDRQMRSPGSRARLDALWRRISELRRRTA